MHRRAYFKLILFAFIALLTIRDGCAVLEWLFGEQKAKLRESDDSEEPTTRFEMLSTDEKFLDFATTLTDLSTLDACYHIVIYNLKKRCGELSEEELGKLSVQLLNCQSEVEQRPIFRCSDDMMLAECTKPMDAVTWKTYQIVGNRARAMCLATQQLQFRRLTEKSVNQLAATTLAQLQSMHELKAGQEQLHRMASDTVRQLFESQQELLVTNEALRQGQNDVLASIADNIKQLQQEKAPIAAGNHELAQLAKKIQELNSTAKLIKDQEAILNDLRLIHNQSSETLAKLDNNSLRLLAHQATLMQHQEEVFKNLQKINATVTEVMATVLGRHTNMKQRISWLTQLLKGTDDKLEVLQCCVLHLAYFLLVKVVTACLPMTMLHRVMLMVVVVANMASQLHHGNSLDFAGLTVFMGAVILGQWFVKNIVGAVLRAITACSHSDDERDNSPLTPAEVRHLTTLLQRLGHTVPESLGVQAMANGSISQPPIPTPIPPSTNTSPSASPVTRGLLHALLPFPARPGPSGDTAQNLRNVRLRLLETVIDDEVMSDRSSRASTPDSHMSRGSTHLRCLGHTMTGSQCRLSSIVGSDFCRRHTST